MPLFAFINQSKSKSLLKKIFRLIYFILFVKSIRLLHQLKVYEKVIRLFIFLAPVVFSCKNHGK